MPRIRARNITAKPNTKFQGSSRASSPAESLAQRLITGAPILVSDAFSTMKLEPSKKVATAPPNSSGPTMPFNIRNQRYVRVPSRLPLRC